MMFKSAKKLRKSLLIFVTILCSLFFTFESNFVNTKAQMPFYDLQPQNIVLRSQFSTSFSTSSNERKHNIQLASKSVNNTFVDVGGEFSFNLTVGERTAKRTPPTVLFRP